MMFLIFHRCHFYIMVKIFNYGGGTFSLPEPNNLIYRLKALEFTQLNILSILEVKRAGNFLAHELMSWAGPFQVVSWAEPSWNRFSIWWAELSWAFSDFEFGELSWAELSSSWTSQKTSSNWNPKFRYGELNELDSVTTTGANNYLYNRHF